MPSHRWATPSGAGCQGNLVLRGGASHAERSSLTCRTDFTSSRFHMPFLCRSTRHAPFTQKVVKLGKMLTSRNYTVIHYGHEDSTVECTENVGITNDEDLAISYPATTGAPRAGPPTASATTPTGNSSAGPSRRSASASNRGISCCTFGANHQPVAEALRHDHRRTRHRLHGGFARFRVFESYSTLHVYRGMDNVASGAADMWYDAVIPNYFDPTISTTAPRRTTTSCSSAG